MQQSNNKNDMISDADRQRQEEIRLKKIKQGLIEDSESQEYQQKREKEKHHRQRVGGVFCCWLCY